MNFPTIRKNKILLLVAGGLLLATSLHPAAYEVKRVDQPGRLETKEGDVLYRRVNEQERAARANEVLEYYDSLRTLSFARASVRLQDRSTASLPPRTLLEILPRQDDPKAATIKLIEGQIFVAHRVGVSPPLTVTTPNSRLIPDGTEFLVAFDPVLQETVVTVFDGEVELSHATDATRVRNGFQGVARPGERIMVRPILEAKNLVQWWLYYPAVINPRDLAFEDRSIELLKESLSHYRAGNLAGALRQFPGFPEASPRDEAEAAYYAALLLGTGHVAEAQEILSRIGDSVAKRALLVLIAAVTSPLETRIEAEPATASEWLAASYAHQSTNNLRLALNAARQSILLDPEFGFGWSRVAELEFSFRRNIQARRALEKALLLAPANAHAHSVQGFVLAALNEHALAHAAFDRALAYDPWLGNGWLGRGIVRIRSGDRRGGLEDLERAVGAEPRRALLRSYLGKAYADAGLYKLAEQELRYAASLDANDPTPFLYSALLSLEQHAVNEAVDDLERSVRLNDNRALFRSRLLLDEDRAVRGANLARVYDHAGLDRIALSEAARAVTYDHANFSAHQFLSDSYNALRDPARFNLRYETPWFGEWLLANLLSPVGATPLSQHISQHEYSRLFARDRAVLSSDTLVRSDGQVNELASYFGNSGRMAWSLDLDSQHNTGTGLRRNDHLSRTEWYTTIKQEISTTDSILLLMKYQDYSSGDHFQYYSAGRSADPDYDFVETQHPILLAGYHREWAPGIHTLFLGGRLENNQRLRDENGRHLLLGRQGDTIFVPGTPQYDLEYKNEYEAWTAELNQIVQPEWNTVTLGGRYQNGEFTAKNRFLPDNSDPLQVPFENAHTERADRATAYGYWHARPVDSLLLVGGITYDRVTYPRHLRSAPVLEGDEVTEAITPKAGLVWTPLDWLMVRGAYTRSLGGVTLDQSYRLEPTQVAGFVQTYRTLFPISLVGPVSAQDLETAGAALEWKFPSRTYVTIQGEHLAAEARNTRGVLKTDLTSGIPTPIAAGGTREDLDFQERSAEFTIGQLLGEAWSVGARYRFAQAELDTRLPAVPVAQYAPANVESTSDLHAATAFSIFNHRSGFFAQADLTYYVQDNSARMFNGVALSDRDLPSDTFPILNVAAGWRFPRQRGDLTVGVLNVTDEDYRLSPLNFYYEMPHERVFYTRLRLRF